MRRVNKVLTVIVAAMTFAIAAPASAQGFGKNKVHYEPLDWAVLETKHLRLHYYAQEESLARRLVTFAESVCVEFDTRFRVEPSSQVPFLLYSSHHLFQQTNASPGLIVIDQIQPSDEDTVPGVVTVSAYETGSVTSWSVTAFAVCANVP